jgi:hypothetical protein
VERKSGGIIHGPDKVEQCRGLGTEGLHSTEQRHGNMNSMRLHAWQQHGLMKHDRYVQSNMQQLQFHASMAQ